MSDPAPEIVRAGERALLVRFPDADLARAVARAQALAGRLRRASRAGSVALQDRSPSRELGSDRRVNVEQEERLPVMGEWILGAGNLLVRLDDSCAVREAEALEARLHEWTVGLSASESSSNGRAISLDVHFGHDQGPDLSAVAREVGRTEAEVVTRFCAAEYTVAFVGFSPGFPYLIGLPPELEVPRLAEPRTSVPAGSVAIAGPFAGVYPSATPGGWRLLGAGEIALFDPTADPPARLAPGDRVRFVAS